MVTDEHSRAPKPASRQPSQIVFSRTTVLQAMTHIPLLAEHVEMVVGKDRRDTFVFTRGIFYGSAVMLGRLRRLLQANEEVDVTLRAHATLAALSGAPLSVMEIAVDPTGALGAG